MDNILFIGPYREFSGVGNASRAYIKSLIRTGHNISIRPIYNLHKDYEETELDSDILELENNSSKKYHTIIEHCYPHQLCYNKKFDKHVNILHLESFGYKSNILQYLNIMDDIIVGSDMVLKELKDKILSKIWTVPEPIDLEYIENYKINSPKKNNKNNYSFYIIADWMSRKNITKAILAFTKVARYYPNIELVIKVKSHIGDDTELHRVIEYELSKIYSLIKNYKTKPKIIIGETSKDGIYYIHNNNNCYVDISSGESFGYSTLEALAFNNNIIVNRKTSQENFVKNNCGLSVDTEIDQCMDDSSLFPIYNSIKQYWATPILNSIRDRMFEALIETETQKTKRINSQKKEIQNYTIDSVSGLFKNIL